MRSLPAAHGRPRPVGALASRPYRRTARFDWPKYLVSAPHRVFAQARWEPYDLWHARVPGSLTTACGLPAIGWTIFWSLRFEQGRGRRCARCARVVEQT